MDEHRRFRALDGTTFCPTCDDGHRGSCPARRRRKLVDRVTTALINLASRRSTDEPGPRPRQTGRPGMRTPVTRLLRDCRPTPAHLQLVAPVARPLGDVTVLEARKAGHRPFTVLVTATAGDDAATERLVVACLNGNAQAGWDKYRISYVDAGVSA